MPYRVLVFGLGRIGSGVARLLSSHKSFRLVGAVCRRQDNHGRDVGEIAGIGPIGIRASLDEDDVLSHIEADAAVHATRPWLRQVEPELMKLAEAGLDVVTLTEEAAYPWGSHPEEAARLDAVARRNGVSLLGTGVNPGFIWDTLAGVLTLAFAQIDELRLTRRTTLSFLSRSTLDQMGIGLSGPGFDEAVRRGDVVGHVGTRQSLEMLGAALGWELLTFEEGIAPVVAQGDSNEPDLEPGSVRGFRQTALAVFDGGRVRVLLEPGMDIQETYDEIEVIGSPGACFRIVPAVEPVATAQAMAVNVLPAVVRAQSGLRTMLDVAIGARLDGSSPERTPRKRAGEVVATATGKGARR